MISALPLTLLTLVSAVSYVRVFDEPSSLVPALLVGLFAHAALRVGALVRAQAVVLGTVVLGGAGLIVTWTIAPHTTAYGVPTGETLQVLGERLGDGFGALRTANVPIGPHDGIVLVVAVGVLVAAVAADWVAFQARAVLSACIPAVTLFTLTATLGEDRHEALLTAGVVAAALSFILAHAPAQAGDAHSWFASGTRTLGPGAVLRAGLPLVVLAAAAAPFVGPRLPEARSAGLVDLSPGSSAPRTRVTVSPLVDIRDRLTQDPPVDVFTVRAGQPAYWRMAALETFDGEIWSSLADYRKAGDELPADSTAAPTIPLVQDYQISNLAQFWLPAAYRPVSIDLPGTRVNVDSLTLLTERETADALAYRVESAVPAYGPADLAGETGHIPDAVLPFIEVPDGLPTVVGRLAREVTAGNDTIYDRALALQAFFRENFAYSEEVPAGHSSNRLVDFLTTARAGFCEQFSASFAVMARTLGIPARVAVGFTPGSLAAPGTFRVTTANAHAWPEIYMDPYGWVAFEPTPSRFNPSPANHTGTFNPEAQPSPAELDPTATATTVVPEGQSATEPTQGATEEPAPPATEDASSSLWRVLVAVVVVLVALGGVLLGIPALRRRRHRQRLAGLDPAGSVLAAWDELVERLRLDGLDLRTSLTPAEAARTAVAHEPGFGAAVYDLQRLVDLAAYSDREPGADDAGAAWSAVRSAVAVLERDESAPRRLRRRLLSPR